MDRRVAVTGLGVISSIGNNVESFWNSLKEGVCGIDFIEEFPTEDLPVKIGGKVRGFDPFEYGMDKAFVRKQDLFTVYGMAAAWQAMLPSGVCTPGFQPSERVPTSTAEDSVSMSAQVSEDSAPSTTKYARCMTTLQDAGYPRTSFQP